MQELWGICFWYRPPFLHTKELVRYHSQNVLFSDVVYISFCLSLSRFCRPTDSLPQSPTLSFSNTVLIEWSVLYVRIFNTYYKDFSIPHNRNLINCISMGLCLFQFSLQNAGFQILCLAIVLFICYSFQYLYFLPDQGCGRQFSLGRKSDFKLCDWFQVMTSGHLDTCPVLFNHFISTITENIKPNREGPRTSKEVKCSKWEKDHDAW